MSGPGARDYGKVAEDFCGCEKQSGGTVHSVFCGSHHAHITTTCYPLEWLLRREVAMALREAAGGVHTLVDENHLNDLAARALDLPSAEELEGFVLCPGGDVDEAMGEERSRATCPRCPHPAHVYGCGYESCGCGGRNDIGTKVVDIATGEERWERDTPLPHPHSDLTKCPCRDTVRVSREKWEALVAECHTDHRGETADMRWQRIADAAGALVEEGERP